ncbi:MAG: Stp1/IreP family PP2C-type Ser/Thr phosphatase [Anaerolineae bacterium]|jgi:protein phosphatase|nr:Stp1/IreP family PP2C-type Ser/Thr phosphatase [Anaerolineae bacterium]
MSNPRWNVILNCDAQSSTGQIREVNEDSVLLWAREHVALAVVADGMGGHIAGEEASRIAVQMIYQAMQGSELGQHSEKLQAPEWVTGQMRAMIGDANRAIVRRSEADPRLRGMGTTVTSAFVQGERVVIGHVGDSRAYHFHAASGEMEQITVDHSFVEAMIAAGHITRAEADDHPMKHVLYRALGQGNELDVDVYETRLEVGDRLVLCSDGLTLHVQPHEIARVVYGEPSPEVAARQLVDLANGRGGRDNITVIVIVAEAPSPAPEPRMVMRARAGRGTGMLSDYDPFASADSQAPNPTDDPDPYR